METGAGETNPRLRVLATVSEDGVRFPASMSGGSKSSRDSTSEGTEGFWPSRTTAVVHKSLHKDTQINTLKAKTQSEMKKQRKKRIETE